MIQHVDDPPKASPTLRMGKAGSKATREAPVADHLPAWARESRDETGQ